MKRYRDDNWEKYYDEEDNLLPRSRKRGKKDAVRNSAPSARAYLNFVKKRREEDWEPEDIEEEKEVRGRIESKKEPREKTTRKTGKDKQVVEREDMPKRYGLKGKPAQGGTFSEFIDNINKKK